MTKSISELLKEISGNPNLLSTKYRGYAALQIVFSFAFLPEKKFLLPEGMPPYKQNTDPMGLSPTNFMNELRRLYIFSPERELNQTRREALFIQLLETIHPDDAILLIAIKDQTLDQLYPVITKQLLVDAGFLPASVLVKEETVVKETFPDEIKEKIEISNEESESMELLDNSKKRNGRSRKSSNKSNEDVKNLET